jgi:hypothetical protein
MPRFDDLKAPPPFKLKDFVKYITQQENLDFAKWFAGRLGDANGGDEGAIRCVESYISPDNEDLRALGIDRSQFYSTRKCTDVGLLVQVITRKVAFPLEWE